MSCSVECVRWILFIFNFIFTICGLGLLICGVLVHMNLKDLSIEMQKSVSTPAISVIIIGCIIFVIAFFGCCGAIKEHHCMTITYAIFLLTILIIQIALSIYVFLMLKGMNDNEVKRYYGEVFNKYWENDNDKAIIDAVQTSLSCCGVHGPQDYMNMPHNDKKVYPDSCCSIIGNSEVDYCNAQRVYPDGCDGRLVEALRDGGRLLGGIVLGIAGVELIGIIFALCLANSIRNADRRAFKV